MTSLASKAVMAVIGSLNVDLIAGVGHLPAPGQTVAAATLDKRLGGKGANQAVAAARQGARVTLIGCVGDDPDGRSYLDHLRREGVSVHGVKTSRNTNTGTALIAVDAIGENQIIVYPGANGSLTAGLVRQQRARIAVAAALLLQAETPTESLTTGLQLAEECGVPVVFNPSPEPRDFPWGAHPIEVLIVNQSEAQNLFSLNPDHLPDDPANWLAAMQPKAIHHLIITRGNRSTLVLNAAACTEISALPVAAIDTVGAGDTFAGVFTAQWAGGMPLLDAVRWANAAAALSTLKPGAQEGMPLSGEVARRLQEPPPTIS
jgi:ribokinase